MHPSSAQPAPSHEAQNEIPSPIIRTRDPETERISLSDNKMDDTSLLALCARGDESAWALLVRRYQGLVYSTALEVGLDEDDASDVFQYVWLELYRSIPRFREPVALPRWLMVATRRQCYKVATARRRVVRETYEEMIDPGVLADEQVLAAESRRLVEEALARIDERCRRFLHLLFFSPAKTTYEQIAASANLAIGSIGPTRARCLQKLKRALGARQ